VVDVANRKVLYQEKFMGLNIGQMKISADGRYVYFPWIIYRRNPITAANIRLGWVLASRIGRVRIDGPARREAVSLDPRGEAIADPYGLALTHDQQRIVMTASGTHELLLYHAPDLPFQDWGSTDTVPSSLLADRDRFDRIPLGGRPLAVRISRDDRLAYVANYLDDSVQVVDLVERRVVRRLFLGGPEQPSLARQGEAIFYDGRRSLDQWYSCHSCHHEGGTLAVSTDTLNDGKEAAFKTVLPLYNVTKTPPWTWHGWQTNFADAMRKSLTQTLLGPDPNDEDVAALTAYLETLKTPPNFQAQSPDAAALRGKQLFHSDRAGCSTCHSEPYFTDGQIHDLGFSKSDDPYQGFNTPSLLGVSRKTLWFHDGRCKSLEQVLTGPHRPADVAGTGELTDEEIADLVAYLKTL
jgi:cytochrome c peroxidase